MICDTCGAVYKSRSQLMIHNWEKHKIKDPELKVRGTHTHTHTHTQAVVLHKQDQVKHNLS